MADIKIFSPPELGVPLGQYSQIARVKAASEFIFIAGQLSTTQAGAMVGEGDVYAQCEQVFENIRVALQSVGADYSNLVQFTTYLVHSQDISRFMKFRLDHFPRLFPSGHYPPNTLLMIDRLVKEPFLVEVQAIAAL